MTTNNWLIDKQLKRYYSSYTYRITPNRKSIEVSYVHDGEVKEAMFSMDCNYLLKRIAHE